MDEALLCRVLKAREFLWQDNKDKEDEEFNLARSLMLARAKKVMPHRFKTPGTWWINTGHKIECLTFRHKEYTVEFGRHDGDMYVAYEVGAMLHYKSGFKTWADTLEEARKAAQILLSEK